MSLFKKFTDFAPNKLFISIVFGALAGVVYAMLLPIFTYSLPVEGIGLSIVSDDVKRVWFFDVSRYSFAFLFFMSCLSILVLKTVSQIILVQVGMDMTTQQRVDIYNRIIKAPISSLDNVGSAKLMATITTDVSRVVQGAKTFPDLVISSVSLIFILGYLFYLNTTVFVYATLAIIFGSISYVLPMYIGSLYFKKGRNNIDRLHVAIRSLLYGTKELKMNHYKQKYFFDKFLLKHEYEVLNNDKKGSVIITSAINYGDLISFLVIGFVAFVFISYNPITNERLSAVIMALLFIASPVSKLLNALPQISMANISLKAINDIFDNLPEEQASQEIISLKSWDTLKLRNLEYSYGSSVDRFSLGPIDLDIHKNEITFIVGGNGSGKSTLSKVISLHYPYEKGSISFGSNQVNDENLNSCRQFISAIFTDFYLFDTLLGNYSDDQLKKFEGYLNQLGLGDKVSIKDKVFSTISLSDGQKKRLALAVTFLENRELYIFDEWAADQDPHFKELFYTQILPAIKNEGKAIIVISHDDRYFDIADRVVTMEEGKIKSISTKTKSAMQTDESLCTLTVEA